PTSPASDEFKAYFNEFEEWAQRSAQARFDKLYPKSGSDEVDERRIVFLAVFLGLDQRSFTVRDFLEWLSTSLPDRRTLAELGLKGAYSEAVLSVLEAHLSVGREKIERMSRDPSLTPGTMKYTQVIRELQQLR